MESGLSIVQALIAPVFAGVGESAGGAHRLSSTAVSRLICAGWCRMTGCAMVRSGAVLWRRAWPVWAAHSLPSGRSSRRVRRCALLAEPLGGGGYCIVASA
jgi:hypothetical protein